MSLLSVQHLSVRLTTRETVLTVIDDLSFEVDAGEVLGIVGESGAGKSLTGMAILGLLDPPLAQSAGEIRLGGRRIDTLAPRDFDALRGRQIAAVFQDSMSSLNPIMTIGRQLVETIVAHHPLSARQAEQRAAELLAEVGIPGPRERLSAYPHQLSGGMRQRAVLALAFACEPRLIIADEPTTALDVSLQAQITGLLKTMASERGAAVVFITHDIGLIAETADRVAVLYAGRLAEIGPTADVLQVPQHPYTRGLIASIPRMDRPLQRLSQIDGAMPSPAVRPNGCAFHPRCPVAVARCHSELPPPIARNRVRAACWLLDPLAVAESEARHNA
jgi:peptide/nickel transport system ATP-binding protein